MMIQVKNKELEEKGREALAWFIVRSATRQEMVAETALKEARLDGKPLVHAVYLPRMTRISWLRRGVREAVDRPLFTGYLFVLLGEAARFDLVTQLAGVHGFMKFDGVPVRVPLREVLDLQVQEAAGEFDTCEDPPRYRPGAKAKKPRKGKRMRKWSAMVTHMDAAARGRCLAQAYRHPAGRSRPLADVVAQEVGLRDEVIRA